MQNRPEAPNTNSPNRKKEPEKAPNKQGDRDKQQQTNPGSKEDRF